MLQKKIHGSCIKIQSVITFGGGIPGLKRPSGSMIRSAHSEVNVRLRSM